MLKLPQEIQEEIALKARKIRKGRKLSQEELSHQSGVSFGSVKRFERTGKISLESLLKIAMVLDGLEPFEQLFIPPKSVPLSLDDIIRSNK